MTARLIAWVVAAALVVTGIGWIYVRGHRAGTAERDLMCKAEVAEIEKRAIAAEREGNALRERSRALADRLAAEAAESKARIATLQGRLDHEIASVSRARRVFDERIVRLLNELSPVRESGGGAPGTPSAGTTAEIAAAAADRTGSAGRGSSAFAVATALNQCRGSYEVCRVQLHSLIDHWEMISK